MDQGLAERLRFEYEKMLLSGDLEREPVFESGYNAFQRKFGPNVLKQLDDRTLSEVMFNTGTRDSLLYWLEFKNDDEFHTNLYGSIMGGNALKFIVYKRVQDGRWVTGSPQKHQELTDDEALRITRDIRDLLVSGANLIEQLPADASLDDYILLHDALARSLDRYNMINRGWVHKYYHLLFPEKLCTFHALRYIEHGLVCLLEKPIDQTKLYAMDGQYVKIARELDLPLLYLSHLILKLFGWPTEYYRVDTAVDGKNVWQEMLHGSFISIGCALDDLSVYEGGTKNEFKAKITAMLEERNVATPSKMANEILRFYYDIAKGDVVAAAHGENILGIGRVTGDYEYSNSSMLPHRKKVQWLIVSDETPLFSTDEGLDTDIYRYKNVDNIIAVRRLLVDRTMPSPVRPESEPSSRFFEEVASVLKRKKQVILYGPPGTGKTYNAEAVCLELAAQSIYDKSYNRLSDREKAVIYGDEKNSGYVRICCFHPSYGYEDFIEGIKPSIVGGQTQFSIKPGIFKSLCEAAYDEPDRNFYLVIDEINRGDISRIFGELIMLIEADKRGKKVILPLSGESFMIPENVYIVGTMNTADRSIALLDVALRRRFGFIALMPDYSLLEGTQIAGLPLDIWLKTLNASICRKFGYEGRNLQIGHAYFLTNGRPVSDANEFKKIIKEDVIPLIEEYSYGDYARMAEILGNSLIDAKNMCVVEAVFENSDISTLIRALIEPYPDLAASLIGIPDENGEEEVGEVDHAY